MFETLKNAFKIKDIRTKILMTVFLLLVYRIGCWLPVPGIAAGTYINDKVSGDSLLGLMSMISGGALSNGALLALGISPYINATIIMQLLTVAFPRLEALSKQGEEGRKKINQYSRYLTLALAIGQAIGIVVSWGGEALSTGVFPFAMPAWLLGIFVIIILTAGTAFTIWIGERITEMGIGNGISMLIFAGIISTAGTALVATFSGIFSSTGDTQMMAIWELIGFLILVVVIFTLIVFVDLAERKIPINYAKQIKGRKQYGGQNTHIPIKINASGVLPIIFAMALLSFPQLVMSLFNPQAGTGFGNFYEGYMNVMGPGRWLYILLTAVLIFFFCYFYAQIQFNPEDVARNIQQYGGFVPGIRPGKPTAEYLGRINKRLTLFGAIFLTFLALVPSLIFSFLFKDASLVNAFSATGLLIVVSVALEFQKQLEGQLMMKHYKGFLK